MSKRLAALLLTAERLQRKRFVLHWQIVLKLFYFQDRMAVPLQVMHVDFVRGPDVLIISYVSVMSFSNELVFAVILNLRKYKVVLTNPNI